MNEGWITPSPDLPVGGVSQDQRSDLPRPVGIGEGGEVPDAGRGERNGEVATGLGVSGSGRLVGGLEASRRGGGVGGGMVAILILL